MEADRRSCRQGSCWPEPPILQGSSLLTSCSRGWQFLGTCSSFNLQFSQNCLVKKREREMVELQEALLGLAETDKLVVMKYVKSALPCFILVIYAPAWNQIRGERAAVWMIGSWVQIDSCRNLETFSCGDSWFDSSAETWRSHSHRRKVKATIVVFDKHTHTHTCRGTTGSKHQKFVGIQHQTLFTFYICLV